MNSKINEEKKSNLADFFDSLEFSDKQINKLENWSEFEKAFYMEEMAI